MTPNVFVNATIWSYGLALAGYLAFGARVAFGARTSIRAYLLVSALFVTAAWAAASAAVAFTAPPAAIQSAAIADALRYALWFAFLGQLLSPVKRFSASIAAVPLWLVLVLTGTLVASVALGEGFVFSLRLEEIGPLAGYVLRLGLAVFGLVLVEQVLRRVQPQMRWAIKPLAVGLAGIFGLDVFFYADAMLFGHLDAAIWISRGFANVIVIPFLAIATARNTGWTVDLHFSRVAVFHSTALLVTGVFLLAVAGAGYFVRYFGGDWGRTLQIELVFAAILLVALVASSGRFRSRLKVFISKHFFSYRYDYREEWLRFTRTLSLESVGQNVHERTIKALADLVESPGGALWLRDEARGFIPAARWNMPPVATDAVEQTGGAFVAFLERTGWIGNIDEWRAHPDRYEHVPLPTWFSTLSNAWLVVPLLQSAQLLGFVVLALPRTAIVIDWEVRDLLKTASRQATSFLAQIEASESLLEARKFEAFNRMSAFVVHDLKNLIAQLSLMLRNAKRHSGNPEFQADMLETVEHVVARMNGLMLQLRSDAHPVDNRRPVNLEAVMQRVCAAKRTSSVSISTDLEPGASAFAHEDRLEHVIGHLVQNAMDASVPQASVRVSVARDGNFVNILVADSGGGMTREFIRDRLFKPFQTTKATGMGIGVYESSQYVASVGGELLVESQPGSGTRVTVRLPQADSSIAPARPLQEQTA